MKRIFLLLGLCLAAALGFLSRGEPVFLLIAGAGAELLVIALARQSGRMMALGFILMVLAAVIQVWYGGETVLLLSSVCASLAAWDLGSYSLLLRGTGVAVDDRFLNRKLLSLGIVLACGWGLGGLALLLKLSLSFGLLLGIAIFVVLSLSISMRYLDRRTQTERS